MKSKPKWFTFAFQFGNLIDLNSTPIFFAQRPINFFAMNILISLRNLVFFLVLSFSGNQNVPAAVESCLDIADPEIEKRVMSLPLKLEVRYNSQVKEQISFFIEKHRGLSTTLLGRAPMYFPMIEEALANHGLPDELKYLPVIEAALVPYVSSHVGASGLWQFMKPTAQMYGLKVTNVLDERRDPEKSTQAAMHYLNRLYNIYGDWTLVLAAYNCGDGVVNSALRKSNSRSYWDIQKYLPRQTQEFVPKFIAIAYLMNYYYLHELEPTPLSDDYVFTATILVNEKIDLKHLAEDFEIDWEVMKRLNPSYTKGFIPRSNGENKLTLPETKLYDFALAFGALDKVVSLSPASAARQRDIVALAEANQRKDEVSGTRPINNLPFPILLAGNSTEAIRMEDDGYVKVVKLTRGKSLADIARENGMELAALMEFNRIDVNSPPRIGDQIRIRM